MRELIAFMSSKSPLQRGWWLMVAVHLEFPARLTGSSTGEHSLIRNSLLLM